MSKFTVILAITTCHLFGKCSKILHGVYYAPAYFVIWIQHNAGVCDVLLSKWYNYLSY